MGSVRDNPPDSRDATGPVRMSWPAGLSSPILRRTCSIFAARQHSLPIPQCSFATHTLEGAPIFEQSKNYWATSTSGPHNLYPSPQSRTGRCPESHGRAVGSRGAGLMPIRIGCHARPSDSRQLSDIAEHVTCSAQTPELLMRAECRPSAAHADRPNHCSTETAS